MAEYEKRVRRMRQDSGTTRRNHWDGSRHRDRRRGEAEARQVERNARTDEEQLAVLRARCVTKGAEVERLLARIKARKVAA